MQADRLAAEDLAHRAEGLTPSPRDRGSVDMIVVRTSEDERATPPTIALSSEHGVVGDRWDTGSRNPETQVTLINTRVLNLVATSQRDKWPLAGDNFVVDLDLGEDNLPPGTRLHLGSATLEISTMPHRGCAKFSARYGRAALRFVNLIPELRRRGVYATVVSDGEVSIGDTIEKI